MYEEQSLVENCQKAWYDIWKDVVDIYNQRSEQKNYIKDEEIIRSIFSCINSSIKTYRYVLPTQIIVKFVNPSLDSRFIQAQRGGEGAFDARTIAHRVIVPFDKQNHGVLGNSSEPYVSNPLRVLEISADPKYRNQQKNKKDWDSLCFVLEAVERNRNQDFTLQILKQVQLEIVRRLEQIRVIYPTPRRISLEKAKEIISTYLDKPSGGDRPEVIATALFRVIGKRLNLYSSVKRNKTNAADVVSGQVADIECLDSEEKIVLAVEVKDRELEINHIEDKINLVREKNVSELLYLVKDGVSTEHKVNVEDKLRKEFSSGQNIYIFNLIPFSEVIFALIGEEGRREFIKEVGKVLDEYSSPLISRQTWSLLLAEV